MHLSAIDVITIIISIQFIVSYRFFQSTKTCVVVRNGLPLADTFPENYLKEQGLVSIN